MICVSVAEPTTEKCIKTLEGLEFAEVRLDCLKASVEDMQAIFSRPLRLIATFMPSNLQKKSVQTNIDNETRKRFLIAAIEAGAKYVDIEHNSDSSYREELIEKARSKNCQVIISFHDFSGTPEEDTLEKIRMDCFKKGADIVKIACKANTQKDNLKLLGLLNKKDYHGKTMVIGMGKSGRITRIVAPLLGSPFTFASLSRGKETAEGQIEKDILHQLVKTLNDE